MNWWMPRTQALALAVVALAVYYPALFAPFSPLDDHAIVEWLLNQQALPLREVFTRTTEYYYRPVLWLSYIADFHLWGPEASFMHLGNLLLHTANVLLLFAIARLVFSRLVPESRSLPFFAALLFAIHPVNTEAVNWIAARSDLLAGFFVLLAAWLLFAALARRRPALAWCVPLPLLLGCLAKETAAFFLPAALVLIYCGFAPPAEPLTAGGRRQSRLVYASPFLLLPLGYVLVRGPALLRHDAGLDLMQKFQAGDLLHNVQQILAGFGFYARKLVWPWPLNLAIDHVPAGYAWLGLLVLTGLCYGVWRRRPAAGLLAASACIGLSAILALLLRPAWTPVAERYLYVPAMFFCLGIALPAHRLWQALPQRQVLLVALGVTGVAIGATTVERTLLWRDNIRLFENTVAKSPDFPFAKSILANLLLASDRRGEGAALVRENLAPEGLRNADFLDLQRAQLLYAEGHLKEARALILAKRRKDGQLYYKFQELLAKVDSGLLQAPDEIKSKIIFAELVEVYLELSRTYRDPFYLYRLAQLHLRAGNRAEAARYFRLAGESAPASAHYKAAALKLAGSLEE